MEEGRTQGIGHDGRRNRQGSSGNPCAGRSPGREIHDAMPVLRYVCVRSSGLPLHQARLQTRRNCRAECSGRSHRIEIRAYSNDARVHQTGPFCHGVRLTVPFYRAVRLTALSDRVVRLTALCGRAFRQVHSHGRRSESEGCGSGRFPYGPAPVSTAAHLHGYEA